MKFFVQPFNGSKVQRRSMMRFQTFFTIGTFGTGGTIGTSPLNKQQPVSRKVNLTLNRRKAPVEQLNC
jgi:hypothetical protein